MTKHGEQNDEIKLLKTKNDTQEATIRRLLEEKAKLEETVAMLEARILSADKVDQDRQREGEQGESEEKESAEKTTEQTHRIRRMLYDSDD